MAIDEKYHQPGIPHQFVLQPTPSVGALVRILREIKDIHGLAVSYYDLSVKTGSPTTASLSFGVPTIAFRMGRWGNRQVWKWRYLRYGIHDQNAICLEVAVKELREAIKRRARGDMNPLKFSQDNPVSRAIQEAHARRLGAKRIIQQAINETRPSL